EAVEIEEEHRELKIFVLARAFHDEFQVFGEQRAVGQMRERIVKSRVSKVILALLQLNADTFLLGDVPTEFLDVAFCLFGTLALGLGAGPFSFGAFAFSLLSLRRSHPDLV